MKKIALVLVGLSTLAVSGEAKAEVGSDNFNPQITFRPNEFPWESGPIGPNPLTVNLTASAYHEVDIEMTGAGDYDFDAQTLTFIGDADGGTMQNALGIEITVVVAVNVLGITTDFEVGVFQIDETVDGTFSPYLLQGDPERPFGVSEAIGPNDLVDQSFTLAGQDVGIDIDWVLNIPEIEYRSIDITLTDGEDSVLANEVGVYDAEEEALDLILPDSVPGETSEMYGTLNGTFDSAISVDFIINLSLNETQLGPFDVNLPYPVNENEPIEFPPELLQYDVPELPEGGSSSSGEAADDSTGDAPDETSGGESESAGDDTTGGDPPSADDSSGGDPGIPADPPGTGESGCGCNTQPSGKGLFWMFGLFGLSLLRRRRA